MIQRVKHLFRDLLAGGLDPKKSSLAVAVGLLWGLFPLVGTTTLLCTASALVLRLNVALTNAANYAVYPLQVLLMVPFFRLGSLFTGKRIQLAVGELSELTGYTQLAGLSGDVFYAVLNTLLGWSLTVPPIAAAAAVGGRILLEKRSGKTGIGLGEETIKKNS